MKARRHFVCAE